MLSRIAAARGSRDAVQERAAAAESRRKDVLEAIVFSSAARDKARRVQAGLRGRGYCNNRSGY